MLNDSSSSSQYSGGVFRFVPFVNTTWAPQMLQAGLVQPQMLSILIVLVPFTMLLLILMFYSLNNTINGPKKQGGRFYTAKHVRKSEQHQELLVLSALASSSQSDQSMESAAVLAWDPVLTENFLKHSLPMGRLNLPPSPIRNGSVQSRFDDRLDSTTINSTKPLTTSAQTSKCVKSRRCYLLGLIIFTLFFISQIVGVVLAIQSERHIIHTIKQLPLVIQSVLSNFERFAHFAVDIGFNISCAHIIQDANRSSDHSHIRPLVNHIEEVIAEAVACLVDGCHSAKTNKRNLFIPHDSRDRNSLRRNKAVSLQARGLLKAFQLMRDRISILYESSTVLTTEFIHDVTRSWYLFQRQLWSITSIAVLPGPSNKKPFSKNWTDCPWFNHTYNIICEHLKHSRSDHFKSCLEVGHFIGTVYSYTLEMPFMLPQRSLEAVVRYTFIPRALGVQELFIKWLPVLTDLPGTGLYFLLTNYMPGEIEKFKNFIHQILSSIPSEKIVHHVVHYESVFDSFMLILFTILIGCVSLLALLIMCGIIVYLKYCLSPRNRHSQANKCPKHSFQPRRVFPYACGLKFICVILIISGLSASIVGAAFVYFSGLFHSELCLYAFHGSPQRVADTVLEKQLRSFFPTYQPVSEFFKIPHLNPMFPNSILRTLDTDYVDGERSFVQSINFEFPVNFTSLLYSKWFNQTLLHAWNRDVKRVLLANNIKTFIPKLSPIDIYNQAKQTTNLDNSFDQLEVGEVTDYLNDPGPGYFRSLSDALVSVGTNEALHLAATYQALNVLQTDYAKNYRLVENTLKKIDNNKKVIDQVSSLVSNASLAYDNIKLMHKNDLIDLIDQVVLVGWPRILPTVVREGIPLGLSLFANLVPFPGLRHIYHQLMTPICPPPKTDNTNHSFKSINPELQQLGLTMFISAISITICALTLFCLL